MSEALFFSAVGPFFASNIYIPPTTLVYVFLILLTSLRLEVGFGPAKEALVVQ